MRCLLRSSQRTQTVDCDLAAARYPVDRPPDLLPIRLARHDRCLVGRTNDRITYPNGQSQLGMALPQEPERSVTQSKGLQLALEAFASIIGRLTDVGFIDISNLSPISGNVPVFPLAHQAHPRPIGDGGDHLRHDARLCPQVQIA